MNAWTIVRRSLRFHIGGNVSIALGVAAATAVLAGALIVGDSMRWSLRSIALQRLGRIDSLLMTEGFFGETLADQIRGTAEFQADYALATPAIMFPNGTAESGGPTPRRVSDVMILGVRDEFWELSEADLRPKNWPAQAAGRSFDVVINQTLADDLGWGTDARLADQPPPRITLGIPKQKLLPSDSALGEKDDLVERLVDLKVLDVVPASGIGRFALYPNQLPPRIAYVPIQMLQDALARDVLNFKPDIRQANVIFLAGRRDASPPGAAADQRLLAAIRPSLEDLGLRLKRVTQLFPRPGGSDDVIFDYYSVSSDRLVILEQTAESIRRVFPQSMELFTYLANDISRGQQESGIPFSMVTAVDFSPSFAPHSMLTGRPALPLGPGEIALNRWAAEDLQLIPQGATQEQLHSFAVRLRENPQEYRIRLTYFLPETTHNNQQTASAELVLKDILQLTRPDESFSVRGGVVQKPAYSNPPTLANDPDLTPEVPGLTDAETIDNWDLPFETPIRIPVDEQYWERYRTTPKAFVSLEEGKRLWDSRFGTTTSFRIPVEGQSEDQVRSRIVAGLLADGHLPGIQLVPMKRNGLAASSGSTPFDLLFLGLSLFVIFSCLILVSLLFRLAMQRRSGELGLYLALGYRWSRAARIWLNEMMLVCIAGATLGTLLGLGYAGLMIWGLNNWWRGAIGEPFLRWHVGALSLMIGFLSGVLICAITITVSILLARHRSARSLLAGTLELPRGARSGHRWFGIVWGILLLVALGLAIAATMMAGQSQAGAFVAAGFLLLTCGLLGVWRLLGTGWDRMLRHDTFTRARVAVLNARRQPLRSTLTIGLVAVASFLVASMSAFQLAPSDRGTGGFDWIARTAQPLFVDFRSPAARSELLRQQVLPEPTRFFSFRYKDGEDASCNNLYQSTQPRVLGVTDEWIDHFDLDSVTPFAWAGSTASNAEERRNPWRLLRADQLTTDEAIPVVIDRNTAWFSLKIFRPGQVFTVHYDTGESVTFRLVGLLDNTILQGSLLVREADFVRAFPSLSGYRYFLIRAPQGEADAVERVLAGSLGDQGFEAVAARDVLGRFLAVQNTYLTTFQALGALGLLLGTFGLAAVQLRNVVERKKELALMRAVGFRRSRLAAMVLIENAVLLGAGLAVGVAAALFATIPHYFFGRATVPWQGLLWMFGLIVLVGVLTGWLASRAIFRLPVLQSLRSE